MPEQASLRKQCPLVSPNQNSQVLNDNEILYLSRMEDSQEIQLKSTNVNAYYTAEPVDGPWQFLHRISHNGTHL